ncbi:MAG: pyridoxamine 5'-phosphate oxidase [Calothrix sp. SM1_5_4]|nr:pyridoxamine 5'-phosphate oxidase [Calothrix sp. SM1_5_4]
MSSKNVPTDQEISALSNPIEVFANWLREAKGHPGINEATAMSLATQNPSGELRVRVVLCKDWSKEGFIFFTNYLSKKGLDLEQNPRVGAVFFWDPMFRQIKISGTVEKTSRQVSEDYWDSRERGSQLSQYVSRQSAVVESREALQAEWKKAEAEFAGKAIPCPENWGGYLLRPKTMEFWIGRENRLHDRYQFEKTGSFWTFSRLSP